MSKTALLFPGQGSQRVGMGRDLAIRFETARRVFAEADAALGEKLSTTCWEGPEDQLTLTANTQPAILTNSIAVLRTLEAEKGLTFDLVAGHSLGEWTALVAAGALDFADAVRLTRLRGKFMQEAVPAGKGAMAAIIGLSLPDLEAVCQEAANGEVVSPANMNGAGQIAIAGMAGAVERAMGLAKQKGAKLARLLPVSAPFHCALMQPAADKLAAELETITVREPRVPVVANVDAQPNTQAARIKDLLIRQVTAPVRWEEGVTKVAELGATRGLELGSGSVLSGLVKRIAPGIKVTTIGEPHEVDAFSNDGGNA
jgi:[acyl-carrier-protein] S-malonyltransferase